jgi:glycosyltransferase involved in cell wall biosynthesis
VNTALSFYNRPEYSTIVGREQIFAFNNLLSRKPDMVFAHRLGAMCPIMVSGNHLPPVVFDLDDVEHVSFARSIRQPPWWWAKWLQYFQVPSLFLGERRAIQCSRRAFVCSEIDRRYLTDVWRLRNVVTIPNAIDIPGECELPKTPTLLFIGNFGYLPNIVGADYLISRVWPKIFSAIPNARLLIAGEHPENIRSFNADVPGVEFRGFVKKLDELYREVRVVCCPIFSGGGTRIKVLEAAAYGKPVVSTTLGAEGIDLLEGQEILLRDDPKGFSEACIQLLRNEDFANRIGKAAHSVVARSYNKSVIVRRIREELIY